MQLRNAQCLQWHHSACNFNIAPVIQSRLMVTLAAQCANTKDFPIAVGKLPVKNKSNPLGLYFVRLWECMKTFVFILAANSRTFGVICSLLITLELAEATLVMADSEAAAHSQFEDVPNWLLGRYYVNMLHGDR